MKLLNKLGVLIATVCLTQTSVQAQVCKQDKMAPTHGAGHYLVLDDIGLVTDIVNGLQWRLCSYGQEFDAESKSCLGNPKPFNTFKEALNEPITEFAGYNNWRLPNIKELGTLVDRTCVAPAINLAIFPSTPSSVYWSSTYDHQINVSKGVYGRVVDFTDGTEFLDNLDSHRFVRLVRSIVE